MRVVAGSARGIKLITRESEDTKPTLDRVKEAMFSMLTPYLPGAKVLDLFSGSGALGIEALSRDADFCIFCDRSKECCDIIRKNLEKSGLNKKGFVIQGDFTDILSRLSSEDKAFDLILLDPPYGKDLIQQTLKLTEKFELCADGGIVLCEHAFEEKFPEEIGCFTMIKDKKYGTVGVTVYEKGI